MGVSAPISPLSGIEDLLAMIMFAIRAEANLAPEIDPTDSRASTPLLSRVISHES